MVLQIIASANRQTTLTIPSKFQDVKCKEAKAAPGQGEKVKFDFRKFIPLIFDMHMHSPQQGSWDPVAKI